jgi:hypothetical protein
VPICVEMQAVADQVQAPPNGSWRVSREGAQVAVVEVRHEGGNVLVSTELNGSRARAPYSFASLEAAETFVNDLIASFAYLGCDVARA